jgi:hypothetical protein
VERRYKRLALRGFGVGDWMMVAAVVDLVTFLVINTIMANAAIDPAPDGCELIDITNQLEVSIGWSYDPATQTFSPPSV